MEDETLMSSGAPAGAERRALAVLVIGSLNMDLVARCPRIPAPGETILGSGFALHPGGKGANGATAAARLVAGPGLGPGPDTSIALLGAVGRDDNGAALLRNLRERGVDAALVDERAGVPTGVALIAVSDEGENSIVVVPGANARLRPEDVEAAMPALAPRVVLLQMEIPAETVERAAILGRRAGARVLLDPAPAPASLSPALLAAVDALSPNEGELAALTGMPVGTEDEATRAAEELRRRGVAAVVVKRGEQGALIVDGDGARAVPAPRVAVVDTTGAGDCFDGALAMALAEGQDLDRATRFATHAAALACTRLGAQEAQPARGDVERLLRGSDTA
jgi:ribokinase